MGVNYWMHAFGVRSICPPLAMHYTRKFGRCPILNKIHHEDTKFFYRIYRMIPFGRLRAGRISAVEGSEVNNE